MKTELKKLVAMPALPDSSRKSPKIIANDDVGLTVVICGSENVRLNRQAYLKQTNFETCLLY